MYSVHGYLGIWLVVKDHDDLKHTRKNLSKLFLQMINLYNNMSELISQLFSIARVGRYHCTINY